MSEMIDIAIIPHPYLRMKVPPVWNFDQDDKDQVDHMAEIMRMAEAIGLAANQILVAKSIAVVEFENTYLELLNPRITWRSNKLMTVVESCLSIPGHSGAVKRHRDIRVEYYTRDGVRRDERFKYGLACVIQHEVDHLNGVLFIDRATEVWSERENDDAVSP